VNAVRHHLTRLSWLAILAMLALALLPTLARAMALSQGEGSDWVEICTAQGMKRVAPDATGAIPPAPQSAPGHLDHCLFCGLSAQGLGLLPAPAMLQDPPDVAASLPRLVLQGPRTLFAWCSAQPRAPPPAA
jgi:hypothetical protein